MGVLTLSTGSHFCTALYDQHRFVLLLLLSLLSLRRRHFFSLFANSMIFIGSTSLLHQAGRHHSRLRRIPKFSSIRDVRGRLPCAHNTVESVSWCDRTDDDDDDDAAAVYVRSLLDFFCVSPLNSGFLRKKTGSRENTPHTRARTHTRADDDDSFVFLCLLACGMILFFTIRSRNRVTNSLPENSRYNLI